MKINRKYSYIDYKRKTVDGSRHYVCGEETLPSVTTILDRTKDKTALEEWANRIGKDNAERIKNEAANRGTKMHQFLEDYFMESKPIVEDANNISSSMAQIVLGNIESKIDEIWGAEVKLYYPGKYAGTTDLVGVWEGKDCIIDFKQANKMKKEEWIDDYKLQMVSYANAHNEVYGTNIRHGVISMCTQFLEYQEFYISPTTFDYYTKLWWERVEDFYKFHKS